MRITLDKGAIMPTRAHDTDAGLDLYSRESKVVPAGGSAVFDTGVHIELHADNSWLRNKHDKPKPHTGTVVYIHPQMRYYTVEFDLGLGKVRESYTK